MTRVRHEGWALTTVRVAHGAVLLLAPRPALAPLSRLGNAPRPPDTTEVLVARVLGLRQLAQAAGERTLPRGRTLGALIDVVHALSMLGWAALDRRHRTTALTSAATALAFASVATRPGDEDGGVAWPPGRSSPTVLSIRRAGGTTPDGTSRTTHGRRAGVERSRHG